MDTTNTIQRLVGDLTEAYLVCRKNKRQKKSSLEFELGWASGIVALAEDVALRRYQPQASIAFIVRRPKLREVFAASFRDRIIHHYITIRLEPLFEEIFIEDTYNCRVGKGTLNGIKRMHWMIRQASENYTKDCWIAKFDIQGFFMSIHKPTLWKRLEMFIRENYKGDDTDTLLYLTEIVAMNRPENNCILHTPAYVWQKLPKNKSLFTCGDEYGLPIGNLTSQMFANFYLHESDLMMKREFGWYGRYVDDFFIIGDKKHILKKLPMIRESLSDLGLRLHPRKLYLQHYTKGVMFIGGVSKPDRTYACNRTITNFEEAVHSLNEIEDKQSQAEHFVCSLNSYIGYLIHHKTYAIRRNLVSKIAPEWWKYIYVGGHFEKIVLKKKYTNNAIMFNKIKEIKNYGKSNDSKRSLQAY